jgi:hypothetical protein
MAVRLLFAFVIVVGVVGTPSSLWAQGPAQTTARPQGGAPGVTASAPPRNLTDRATTGTGIVRGHTRRADTGAPLARAYVVLAPQVGEPRAVTSDESGAFEFRNLAAGRYQVNVSKSGYAPRSYGPRGRATNIELDGRQAIDRIDVSLPSGGVIEGIVVDERGEPVEEAQVTPLRVRYVNGERQLQSEGQLRSFSDDLGRFRIFGLDEGEHYLQAGGPPLEYDGQPATYYPGTFIPSEAQLITIAPGQEVGGLVVRVMRASHLARVSGTVTDSRGRPAAIGSVTLMMAGQVAAFSSRPSPGNQVFTIRNVPPGNYTLSVTTQDREPATAPVVVGDADVSLALVALASAALKGRIVFDGNVVPPNLKPDMVGLNLGPSYQNGTPSLVGSRGGIRVAQDWTFESPSVIGSGFIRGAPRPPSVNRPDSWMLKRIVRRGVDVTDTPIDFSAGVDDLEVVLTTRVTFVTGRVNDGKGAMVRDADVVIFEDDRDKWRPPTRFVRVVRPNQAGNFSASSLPPGRYLVTAVDAIETGEEQNPAFLESLRQKAIAFTIGEGETKSVDVKLSSP